VISMSKKVAYALLGALLVAVSLFAVAYHFGLLGSITGNTTSTYNSSSVALNTSNKNSNSNSSISIVISNNLVEPAKNVFTGFVNGLKDFLSYVANNIASSTTRMDLLIRATVYSIVFFLLGKFANMIATIVKWFFYGLAIFSIVVALVALLGLM